MSQTLKALPNSVTHWQGEWRCLAYVLNNHFSFVVSANGPAASTDAHEGILFLRENSKTFINSLQAMNSGNMTSVVMVKLCTEVPNLYRCTTYTKLIEYMHPTQSATIYRCNAKRRTSARSQATSRQNA